MFNKSFLLSTPTTTQKEGVALFLRGGVIFLSYPEHISLPKTIRKTFRKFGAVLS